MKDWKRELEKGRKMKKVKIEERLRKKGKRDRERE